MPTAFPLTVLGQDDWLFFARDAAGILRYAVTETDAAWLDTPHGGDCWDPATGLNCDGETRYTCRRDCAAMLARVTARAADYEWSECGNDPVCGDYLGWPASGDAAFTARSRALYLPAGPACGQPCRPPGKAHQLPVLRELGWATWAGAEPQPGDPGRHKHDAAGVPFFAHSHGDASPHDHMPPPDGDSGQGGHAAWDARAARAAQLLFEYVIAARWDLAVLPEASQRALRLAAAGYGTGRLPGLDGVTLRGIPGAMAGALLRDVAETVSPARVARAMAPHEPSRFTAAPMFNASGTEIYRLAPGAAYPVSAVCETCGGTLLHRAFQAAGWVHDPQDRPAR